MLIEICLHIESEMTYLLDQQMQKWNLPACGLKLCGLQYNPEM